MSLIGYVPYLFCVSCIYLMSNDPNPIVPDLFSFRFSDKMLHACAYSVVGAAAYLGACWRRKYSATLVRKQAALEALVLGIGSGIFDEAHQSFIVNRSATVGDVAADAIGAAVGVFFCLRVFTSGAAAKEASDR